MATNGKRALVILGAGASHDLFATPPTNVHDKFLPPLTKDLFGESSLVRETLRLFPGAMTLASSVSIGVAQGRAFEEILAELSLDHSSPAAEHFREVALYLRELFWLVSENYTNHPVNYDHLTTTLLHQSSGISRVAFVTLNYDLLLDKVLQRGFLGQTGEEDSYISKRCILVKLHGSVDWVRPVRIEDAEWQGENLAMVDRNVHRMTIRRLDVHQRMHGEMRVHRERNLWDADHLYYPILSVPLGEYDFACFPDHVDALKEFLPGCKNLLSIGFSAKDSDLLTLLAGQLSSLSTFCFVAFEGAEEAAERFKDEVPQVEGAANQLVIPDEFSSFLRTGGLEAFIESCE